MSDFHAQLNRVLKYVDGDTVNDLLQEIAADPKHQHTHDSSVRLIAADALDDVDRHDEAKWLRQRRPVAIRDGKVVAQDYTRQHVRQNAARLDDAVNHATESTFDHTLVPRTFGHHAVTTPHLSAPPTEQDHKNNNYNALSHWHGWLESFDSRLPSHADDPNAEVIHHTQYPEWLANKYRKVLDEGGHWANMTPAHAEDVNYHLERLAGSPVTVDAQYPEAYEHSFSRS